MTYMHDTSSLSQNRMFLPLLSQTLASTLDSKDLPNHQHLDGQTWLDLLRKDVEDFLQLWVDFLVGFNSSLYED